ncbi:MAG: hypothetical protein IH614_01515, partial [Desulfuromonadales bacterium]|nr:hypothetical protein [Desulfuromonadales bacterium]
RLMDEGRYIRQKVGGHRPKPPAEAGRPTTPPPPLSQPAGESEIDMILQELVAAHQACKLPGALPDRGKIAAFLEQQREKIREKFGDQPVAFRVELEGGKPRIKVRAKQ